MDPQLRIMGTNTDKSYSYTTLWKHELKKDQTHEKKEKGGGHKRHKLRTR